MATTYQRITFQPYMRDRFLVDRQGRRKLEQGLTRKTTAFYIVAGGSIRTAARRLLKRAGPKPYAELTESEKQWFDKWNAEYKAGRLRWKPRKPDKVSKPGRPPLLHSADSLLKKKLFFALSHDKQYVVIGPEVLGYSEAKKPRKRPIWVPGQKVKNDHLRQLEYYRPFMVPAYQAVEPRMPEYIRRAFRGI